MFLQENKKDSLVYVCGTESLKEELKKYGVKISEDGVGADTVLLGYDTELDYKKIRTVCDLLDGGADYYATNIDMVCPIEGGRYLPDCGSFADMFEQAVKRRPRFLGKPDRTMIDIIAKAEGVPYENIAMVGDRIYTDVKTGINAGVTSILVLSGETTMEDYKKSDVKPDYILDSVKDILDAIK
jgi:HAD superfamily hydrolase (TIGR01450 family)